MAGGGGGGRPGGWTDGGGQMSIEVRSSEGLWGIYPGTQLRQGHRASWAMMRFTAQPARCLFIVRVGLLPSAQFCRKLRDTLTINNCKY